MVRIFSFAALLRNRRKTVAVSSAPPKDLANLFTFWRRASAPFALLRNARKTVAVSSAPPKDLANLFTFWRRASAPFALLILLTAAFATAQDAITGLGRIYIEPVNGSFEKLLSFEIVRQRIPVMVVDSPKSADCVLGWTTVPGVEGRTDFVLIDRQTRSVVWEFGTRTDNLSRSKRNGRQKITVQMVHSLAKQGAYCGGAAFSAPSQSADERVKAFKPPTFNW